MFPDISVIEIQYICQKKKYFKYQKILIKIFDSTQIQRLLRNNQKTNKVTWFRLKKPNYIKKILTKKNSKFKSNFCCCKLSKQKQNNSRKMRTYLILLLGLTSISMTLAAMCSPEKCATMLCAQVTVENCVQSRGPGQYRVQPHGGFCGCCPSCQKILR